MPRLLALPILVLLLAMVPAASAHAAKRKAPFGFVGTVLTPDQGRLSDAQFDQQAALMARSGVENVRATFSWRGIETAEGVYNWAATDRLVGAMARHRIPLLATVIGTPRWASTHPDPLFFSRYAPRDPKLFAAFVGQLVGRYGPNGSFWTANPTIPKTPVRQWQIWNEQIAAVFWATRPWPKSYTRLLKLAYQTIHRADRGATVVAGSFAAFGSYTQWAQTRDLYKAHARRYFDEIAVHPFTIDRSSVKNTTRRVFTILRRVRAVMKHYHDARKPMIVTELSWPAALGKIAKSRLLGLETTTQGQIARLKDSYLALAKQRRKLHLTQAYWFAWATTYDRNAPESDVPYRFSGLLRYRSGVFSPMPALKAFAGTAARLEGCRKGTDARRCP